MKNGHIKEINIRYIDNKVVYLESGVRRTSYYLTDEGYNMMLSTMEMENNLKLSVHEMLFKLHLEKADYNRAVDDIKKYFRSASENRARRSRRQSCRSGEMRWPIQWKNMGSWWRTTSIL